MWRGRFSKEEWLLRARYLLRHLDDPISLQRSPLCQLVVVEKLAKERYSMGVVPKGRALRDLVMESLQEIENELDGPSGVAKLKAFVTLTRQGLGVTKASRSIGVTPEYASRALKRNLVELLTDKLLIKLH